MNDFGNATRRTERRTFRRKMFVGGSGRGKDHFRMVCLSLLLSPLGSVTSNAKDVPAGEAGYAAHVKPFFNKYCVECHGPKKSKGDITLHTLDGAFELEQDLSHWEDVLEVLEVGEMPPEDEAQPTAQEREAIKKWIDNSLRAYVKKASQVAPVPMARRLTNFEYQNTMRDLLGFELDFSNSLPEDPKKPYHFNNTAEFMLLGPEQIQRYLQNARRAMASAIVDPGKPKVIRKTWKFQSKGSTVGDFQHDEIHVRGSHKGGPARGISISEWPATGEYRIRVKAAAILPKGIKEVPLRLVMGTELRTDQRTGRFYPVGTVHLTNNVDEMKDFTFQGRIENHPVHVGRISKRGKEPDKIYLYPQNIFDNGRLRDFDRGYQGTWGFDAPRAVVSEVEFEAPVIDVWPPVHHTKIMFDSPLRTSDPKAYVKKVLERFMSRAFRRPAQASEVDRFVRLYQILEPEFGTMEATLRETLSMVLIAPQFLYHTVVGNGLSSPQYELASRLSYFLWGSMPDEELLLAASQEQLSDPKVLESHVRRMMKDKRTRAFVDNFTTQWMSIEKMKAVIINLQLFPRFLYTLRGQEELFRPTIRDYMHEETVGFVGELIDMGYQDAMEQETILRQFLRF